MAAETQLTPMMAQYRRIKGELPKDALLLFRLGDFYEMFFEDAQAGAQLCNLALTKRNGIPMCGLPFHAANGYIARILKAGRKVAICDQMEDPAQAKGLAPDQVLLRHALKNAAIPIVTIIGIGVALLISGAIVTETVFALPGIGRLTVDAILRRDYPIIQGVTLLFSAIYVLVNLAVDLSYALFDPRIRYQK